MKQIQTNASKVPSESNIRGDGPKETRKTMRLLCGTVSNRWCLNLEEMAERRLDGESRRQGQWWGDMCKMR